MSDGYRFSRRTRLAAIAACAPIMVGLSVVLVVFAGVSQLPFAIVICWLVVEAALREFPRSRSLVLILASNALARLLVSAAILLLVTALQPNPMTILGTTAALVGANVVWIGWGPRRHRPG